jgi:transposase
MMATKAELQAAIKKYGSQRAAAEALGIGRSTIYDILNGRNTGVGKGGGRAKAVKKDVGAAVCKQADTQKGRSLSDFRQAFDKDTIIPAKIKEGLKELGASWEYETEFTRRCLISQSDVGNYRELFADHVVFIRRENKRVWAGTKSLAAEMRSIVG